MIKQAKWISAEQNTDSEKRYPASIFKNTFVLSNSDITKGKVFSFSITAHGVYKAFMNGHPVSEAVLEPGPGNYNERLEYCTFNVSSLLKEGENELTVVVGDGWYRGCNGIDGLRNLFGQDCSLLCALYDDEKCYLISDENFQASQEGPIRFNDLEQGEIYDARMENVTSWHNAFVLNFNLSNLVPCESNLITPHERMDGEIITTPNGEKVIDFHQNLAGYTHFVLSAKEGDTITLWHGETLDENGNFTQANYEPGERNKEGGIPQKIHYICKDGINDYAPSFSIFGYRYAKIETNIDLIDARFESIAVYSDMKQRGTFESSNEKLNKLFSNSIWSMKSNFCGIPTDCPTRERAGWTGDAGVFINTGLLLMDCEKVMRKWLKECAITQEKNGMIANISPKNNAGGFISKLIRGSAGWGDAVVIVPMAIYRFTGDISVLEENYDMMKKWVDFSANRAKKSKIKNLLKKNPYRKYMVDTGLHFGEWCEPDVDSITAMKNIFSKGAPEIATAYFYQSAKLMSEAATVLGKEQDANQYANMAENAAKAWHTIATNHGEIHSVRQADYVRAIAFDLLSEDEMKKASASLNQLVIDNNYHLNTGFLSTPYLLKTLSNHGYTETAYKLLLQEECPSWLYAINKGATTIWETWDGIRNDGTVHDSLNHYSYGSVSEWLIGGIGGIQYSFDNLIIAPNPNPMVQYVKTSYDSPKGIIRSEWYYDEKNKIHYQFSIPDGMTSKIVFPNGKKTTLSSGTYSF